MSWKNWDLNLTTDGQPLKVWVLSLLLLLQVLWPSILEILLRNYIFIGRPAGPNEIPTLKTFTLFPELESLSLSEVSLSLLQHFSRLQAPEFASPDLATALEDWCQDTSDAVTSLLINHQETLKELEIQVHGNASPFVTLSETSPHLSFTKLKTLRTGCNGSERFLRWLSNSYFPEVTGFRARGQSVELRNLFRSRFIRPLEWFGYWLESSSWRPAAAGESTQFCHTFSAQVLSIWAHASFSPLWDRPSDDFIIIRFLGFSGRSQDQSNRKPTNVFIISQSASSLEGQSRDWRSQYCSWCDCSWLSMVWINVSVVILASFF